MWQIRELNGFGETIGLIDFKHLDKISGLETYWNTKIERKDSRLIIFDYSEAKRVYEILNEKHEWRIFELINLLY